MLLFLIQSTFMTPAVSIFLLQSTISYSLTVRKVVEPILLYKKREMQTTNLIKLHRTALALALLKVLKQERARLLISLVDLQTFVEHGFVVATWALQLLLVHNRGADLRLLGGDLASTASTKASSNGSDSLVSNGRTSTESHTLSNGGSNSREHASRFLGRGGGGSRRSLGRGATGGCATAASAGARSSSSASSSL
jgi:hypothetical protein